MQTELRPIPSPDPALDEVSFRLYPIDLTRPESSEPLVDACAAGLAGLNYYARADGMNPPYYRKLKGSVDGIWLRRTVVEKLLRVNAALTPLGVELYLLDGYRTIECQTEIYWFFLDCVRRSMPGASEEELKQYVRQFIAWPGDFDAKNPKTWISHKGGAAVDLTLRVIETGEHLFMGGVFDDPSDVSHTDFFELASAPRGASADEARRNRRLLYWSMWREGFASLPSEWWHYNYGDQLWAKDRRFTDPTLPVETAWYGPAEMQG